MSCPSWDHVGAASDRPEARISEAMRSHAATCPACYPKAVRLDPTVAFARLPEVAVSADDIESMKRAVATMRRSSAVGGETTAIGRAPEPVTHRPTLASIRWPANASLLRAAAVAAVVIGGSLGVRALREQPAPVGPVAVVAPDARAFRLPESTIGAHPAFRAAAMEPARLERGPLVENVKGFEVIQMAGDDLDLVVLVPSTQEASYLDV